MHIEIIPWQEFLLKSSFSDQTLANLAPPPAGVIQSGDEFVSDAPRFTLLISRLPRRILGEDAWLKRLREAIAEVAARNGTLICGEGAFGWDYSAWFAARCGVSLMLIITPDHPSRFSQRLRETCRRLDLKESSLRALMPVLTDECSDEDKLRLRDRLVFELAQHRLPIALRPGSNWRLLLDNSTGMDERFLSPYPRRKSAAWPSVAREFPERLVQYRLFHWTRGVYGPWLGESDADYFRDLTASTSGNPRDACSTLARIISEGVLRGEARMNRGGTPMISLTALNPTATARQARYRPTLGRWNFEPYGLSLPISILQGLGARPVIYGGSEDYTALPPNERSFFQFKGQDRTTDWAEESEWRLLGDLDLRDLRSDVHLWAPDKSAAARLERLTSLETISLTD